ncbi:MAG: mechanosensitive ion channel [Candidatus Nezhaarchaeales archaeon]
MSMGERTTSSKEVNTYRETSKALLNTVLFIVIYVLISAAIQYMITTVLPMFNISILDYAVYIHILLALAFGYLIISGVANFFYWTLRAKHDHPTAAAIRNVVRIIGLGAMIAAIAGGAAGVALGGFLGIVIGFASQQVLGQAVAGLFLLMARPFKIGDSVVIAGEDGVIEDVATLNNTIVKHDGTKALIPNSSIIGSKILLKPRTEKT